MTAPRLSPASRELWGWYDTLPVAALCPSCGLADSLTLQTAFRQPKDAEGWVIPASMATVAPGRFCVEITVEYRVFCNNMGCAFCAVSIRDIETILETKRS